MTRPLLALPALLSLLACSHTKDQEEAAAPTPVQVAAARTATIDRIVNAEGVLYPVQQDDIVPKASAPVQRYFAQRGDHVKQGQLLAVLENKDLVAAKDEAEQLYQQAQSAYESTRAATLPNDLTKAKADFQSAQEGLDAARRVYDSRVQLVKEGALARKLADDAKVALVQAQSQFDTAQQSLATLQSVGAKQQLRGAEAQLQAAKARLEAAQANLAYSEVRSGITGVVADRPLNIGEMASTGSALFSIVDISRIVLRTNVPVDAAATLRPGSAASIGDSVPAKVTVVSPAVDPNSTTVQVWVQADNRSETLKPGSTAKASITAGRIANAIVVPVAALLGSDEGGERVLIAGSDGLAHEHKVKTGVRNGDDVQILSGVQSGDKVITEGGLGLDDKAKIKLASAEDSKGTEDKD